MQLFGTSGIRRLVDQDLIKLAFQVGLVAGSLYNEIILGRDTRTSGSALRHSLVAGIIATGAHCCDAGIVPTPTLAFAARKFQVGIMITASHNPPEYNGLKLLNPDGSAFSIFQQKQIEKLIENSSSFKLNWDRMKTEEITGDAISSHIARIKEDFPDRKGIRVVVDCGGGAACGITPVLLESMGCDVIKIYCDPAGIFPREMEPIESNLMVLCKTVRESGANLGIAHDGDADRMMAVDEKGRFIPGDKIMAILAKHCGTHSMVTTVDASMSIDDLGVDVRRTRVGDPYVSEELKNGGEFGGEPSGAWIFPKISFCPDGIYAAALITAIAANHRLSDLVDSIPSYPVIRGNLKGSTAKIDDLKNNLIEELHPLSYSTLDGIKLNFKYGWLLVRPSGTEPKIRVTAEARNQDEAEELYRKSTEIIQKYL